MKETLLKLMNLFFLVLLVTYVSCSNSSDAIVEPEKNVVEEEIEEEEIEEEEPSGETFSSVVEQHGQLSISGNKIINKDGEAVQLRGMSFFWSQWMGQYYTKEAVKWLKDDWQATIVRAAMAVDAADGYITNPSVEKAKIIEVVDAAIAEGIYVIIDWHSHHAENYLEEAKAFFSEMAQKYGSYPNVIYEPYNEPLDVSWTGVIKPYHEAVIASIREHDPDNIVICGTRTWSQRVDEVVGNKISDANVAYTLHYYAATHKQSLRDIADVALNGNVPIFVTEYGLSEASGDGSLNEAEANTWWDYLDSNKISWCNWSIADKVELSAALNPGASPLGNWSTSDITQSGTMVRNELKTMNPNY